MDQALLTDDYDWHADHRAPFSSLIRLSSQAGESLRDGVWENCHRVLLAGAAKCAPMWVRSSPADRQAGLPLRRRIDPYRMPAVGHRQGHYGIIQGIYRGSRPAISVRRCRLTVTTAAQGTENWVGARWKLVLARAGRLPVMVVIVTGYLIKS